MATATAYAALDMTSSFDYFIELDPDNLVTATSTELVVLGPSGQMLTIGGVGFEYTSGFPSAGTATSITEQVDDATTFSATGISVTIDQVLSSFVTGGGLDIEGIIGFALRGANSLVGSDGNDTLLGYNGNDTVNGGSGVDTLWGGGGADNLKGGAASGDTLYGENGNDTLNGGTGADVLIGGLHNDTYIVDNVEDGITENLDEGTDSVRASVSYVLSPYVENLVLLGTGNINGTGNDQANSMTGNAGINILDGSAGNDILIGLAGNDTYYVDSATDTVTEVAGGGADIVYSSAAAFTLPVNVERLIIDAAGNANGTGNALANRMDGNDFTNVLRGMDGNDVIYGNGGNDNILGDNGNDRLVGGSGNDALHGLAGTDVMEGGSGNDAYWAEVSGDQVIETADGGMDTLYTKFTTLLADYANVENLILTGSAAINGTGTAGANSMTGGTGNNILNGGGGSDTLLGGTGNDTLNGGNGDDNMNGGGGSDSLNGGTGFDTMAGGAGSDRFIFNTSLASDTNNSVIDFVSGTDKLVLDDDIFTALTVGTTLASGAFYSGSGISEAHDANDRIIYDTGTGNLYYDADGTGTGSEEIQFANISGGPVLAATDIEIVA
ncbi:MAG: calcium-binding protein [Elusimicrobia bacterium]|nr:calcium-binding protein [Elusimicrobiota bacterium]